MLLFPILIKYVCVVTKFFDAVQISNNCLQFSWAPYLDTAHNYSSSFLFYVADEHSISPANDRW